MHRQSGFSLIELMVALSIALLGVLGFFVTFYANFSATRGVGENDEAGTALQSVAELLRNADFETIYTTYDGTSVEVVELQAPDGGPARVSIVCFVDETALPADFGPVLDLDGRGGLETTDCSGTYKLLPIQLSISYGDVEAAMSRRVHLLIAPKT